MKKVSSFALCVVLCLLSLAGCRIKQCNTPMDYPYTKWVSKDNSIVLYVGGDKIGFGSVKLNDETADMYFTACNYEKAFMCGYIDSFYANARGVVNTWGIEKCNEDIAVLKSLDSSEKFELVCVQKNLSEDEIPYPPKQTKDNPFNYVSTKWESSCKTVTVYVDVSGVGYGCINVNGEKKYAIVEESLYDRIIFFDLDVHSMKKEDNIALYDIVSDKDKVFILKTSKQSNFFEEGREITLTCVEENVPNPVIFDYIK